MLWLIVSGVLAVYSVRDEPGLHLGEPLSPPPFFVSVASKELRFKLNDLESTLTGCLTSIDSKGAYVAPELCNSCLCSF